SPPRPRASRRWRSSTSSAPPASPRCRAGSTARPARSRRSTPCSPRRSARAPRRRCCRWVSLPLNPSYGSFPFAAIQHRLVLAAFLEEVDRLVVLEGEAQLHVVLAAGLLLAARGRFQRLAAPRLVIAERARPEIGIRHLLRDHHPVLRRAGAVARARMLLRIGADQRRVVRRRRRRHGGDADHGNDEKACVTHGHILLRRGLARG